MLTAGGDKNGSKVFQDKMWPLQHNMGFSDNTDKKNHNYNVEMM